MFNENKTEHSLFRLEECPDREKNENEIKINMLPGRFIVEIFTGKNGCGNIKAN